MVTPMIPSPNITQPQGIIPRYLEKEASKNKIQEVADRQLARSEDFRNQRRAANPNYTEGMTSSGNLDNNGKISG